ncbi:MAG TPA: NAD(P)/FAD-dependent oxidoreductase [Candidatus Bilamarchaeum sp.]|nr:NAD(P)/FAD-dependent oxidoreductase [Candidatus Bilamarchaeum sp.]
MADYDTIIIGAGIAGMSAAVFTARAKLKTLIIGLPEKSQLHFAQSVGNYIGTDGISGPELLSGGLEQVKKYGAEFLEKEVVHVVKRAEFSVKTADNKSFTSKTLIIASGMAVKLPGIKNDQALLGKGVHTCVACDGYPYKGKKVAVIGNGNHAAEEAIELLALTGDITILSNGREFDISKELLAECGKGKVKFSKDRVAEFRGGKWLEALVMKDGSEQKFDGVFLALGGVTSLTFAQKLALDTSPEGFLVIDRDGKTAIDGCYAAGGCTGGNQQIAKSAGEGCNAGISAIRKVKGVDSYTDQT